MPLGSSLTLSKDVVTPVATNTVVYTLRAADLDRSIFSVQGLTLPIEKKLTVSHETGKAGEQRHLVRFDRTEVDAYGVSAVVSFYFVIIRPINTAITNAIIIEEVNRAIHFMTIGGSNANITAILNGEV